MAEPGDMIEIIRPKYSHWALYVGNGYVLHLTTDGVSPMNAITQFFAITGLFAGTGSVAIVKKEKLKDAAAGGKWLVNNYPDKKYPPKSPEDILKEAELLVGQKIPNHLLTNNSEHFVTNLRYGKPECRQVVDGVVAEMKRLSMDFLGHLIHRFSRN